MLVLWAPYLRRDSRLSAQRGSLYLQDSRVSHFWDLWRFGSRTFANQLGVPIEQAWDMFVVYGPRSLWNKTAPTPEAWFQNRALKVGVPYSMEALEAELKKWLN